MHTSPIKFNLTLGSSENLEMLRFFQGKSINGHTLYEGPNFFLIEKQWYDNLPLISLFVFITRVIPMLVLVFFLYDSESKVALWVLFSICVVLIINELNQMRILGLVEYFGETLNIMDLFGNICGIIWLCEYNKVCMFDVPEEDSHYLGLQT